MSLQTVRLQDLCISISDGDHQAPPKSNSGIPFITISNITSMNQLDFSSSMFVPRWYYEKLDIKRKAQKNDILYSVVGSFGIPVFMKNSIEFVFQRHIALLRPNIEKIVPQYLYYKILDRAFYMMADSLAIGAAQRTITLSSLRNIEINIPEVEQQQSIVDILSAYDDLIENNQKQIKLLEETVQRLYKEWFIDLRFPGHGNGEIIDGLPLGWHEDTIDTKVNLLNGFAFKSKDLKETGLLKLVTIKNVQDGYFEGKNVKYLSKIPDKMPRHCHLDEGDLLLSLTGNVGRVCIVEGNDFLLNQRVAKISSETPAYTYCLFRSNELLVKINNIANGAAQQNVSPIRIGQIKHLFPNDKLIMDFERVSGPILKRVVLMKKNIILLEEARDRLLPKLMNGEIEV